MTVDGESELVWEEGERRRARADRRRSLARVVVCALVAAIVGVLCAIGVMRYAR